MLILLFLGGSWGGEERWDSRHMANPERCGSKRIPRSPEGKAAHSQGSLTAGSKPGHENTSLELG